MIRFVTALLLAIGTHGLFLWIPLTQQQESLPQPVGAASIQVSLASVIREATADEQKLPEKEVDAPPPVDEPTLTEKISQVPETVVIEQPTITPPEPVQQKTVRPIRKKQRVAPRLPSPKESTKPALSQQFATTVAVERDLAVEAPQFTPAIVEAKPDYQKNAKPPYPKLAQRRGWQGTVMLSVLVHSDGGCSKVRLHTSSGYEVLDATALKTVKKWRFHPGTRNGSPKAMEVLIPVRFILGDKES